MKSRPRARDQHLAIPHRDLLEQHERRGPRGAPHGAESHPERGAQVHFFFAPVRRHSRAARVQLLSQRHVRVKETAIVDSRPTPRAKQQSDCLRSAARTRNTHSKRVLETREREAHTPNPCFETREHETRTPNVVFETRERETRTPNVCFVRISPIVITHLTHRDRSAATLSSR
jgi:hypothetical protein